MAIKYEITDLVIQRKWITVAAKRDNLLRSTDWTQLLDTKLSHKDRSLWEEWRNKVKQVTELNYKSFDDAINRLTSLQDQIPKLTENGNSNNLEEMVNEKVENSTINLNDIEVLLDESLKEKILSNNIDLLNIIDDKLARVGTKILSDDLEYAKTQCSQLIEEFYRKKLIPLDPDLIVQAKNFSYWVDPSKFGLLKLYADFYNSSIEEYAKLIYDEYNGQYENKLKITKEKISKLLLVRTASSIEELYSVIEFI